MRITTCFRFINSGRNLLKEKILTLLFQENIYDGDG